MVNKITKKAILDIKKNVDAYGKEMAAISEKIATVDEKYRKLAEKETKDLRESYAALEEEQEIWNSSLSRYDADVVNEVLGNISSTDDDSNEPVVETATEKVAFEEDKVVDTIFEENNMEEETNVTPESKSEASAVEENVFSETSEAPETLEVAAEGNADWNNAVEEDETVSTAPAPEDEWSDLPEDWK